jgi:predicted component of type VI protein secretion system
MELPLFEKLFMLDSNQASSDFLSEKQYLASIRTEISRLLETRVSTDVRLTANHNITTYGVPDAFFFRIAE